MKKSELKQLIREAIEELTDQGSGQAYVLTFNRSPMRRDLGEHLYSARKYSSISEANASMKKVAEKMTKGPEGLGEPYTEEKIPSVQGAMKYTWPTEYYTYTEISCPVEHLGELISDPSLKLPDITSGDIEHLISSKSQGKLKEIIGWYKGPTESLGEELVKRGFQKSVQSYFKGQIEVRVKKLNSGPSTVDILDNKQMVVSLPDFDKVAYHTHKLLRDHRGNYDYKKVADLADRLASREKSEVPVKSALAEVIRSMIKEQVLGQTAPTSSTLGSTTSTSSTNTSTTADQTTQQMSDSDTAQLTNMQTQQSKLTNDVRDLDGQITKLQEPVKRQVQKLELRKADATKKLGSVTKQITDLNKKYGK